MMIPDYAELHCLSAFSFLRGASEPAELVQRADELGYTALAITDECSLAGVVRAHSQLKRMRAEIVADAKDAGEENPTITLPQLLIGSEFLVRCDAGEPLFKLVVLTRNLNGYGNLCQFITRLRCSAPKGTYRLLWPEIDPAELEDCLLLLVPPRDADDEALLAPARWLLQHFTGRSWIAVELLKELGDELWLHRMRALSEATALPLVAAGDVHMHRRSRKALQDVMTATRLGKPISECGFELQPNAERHLRSRFRLAQLYPADLLAQTVVVASLCKFSLDEIRYQYPSEVVPKGTTPARHLRRLTCEGMARRWPDGAPVKWRRRILKELALIEELHYEHYFLTVADIVDHARSIDILCQGRGSAANSIVCYCLHITSVNPEHSTLLFERFISRERNEPPDIDVDFEHEQRERVIQYLYNKYGRDRAALTAVVISYRPRSAIRDVGKALGMDEAVLGALAQDHQGWSSESLPEERLQALQRELGIAADDLKLRQLVRLSRQLMGMPRHLSQHVGGFVLTEGLLSRLVPIENATMVNRNVVEWDKDDLDALNLMKVDVLALGMLSCIQRSFKMYRQLRGLDITLASVPTDDEPTYDMICKADTVGVFQIESRAQMSMLPRLRPRCYYDLVVEVAIVRPGPIEGGMVHPYLKARAQHQSGKPIVYPKGLEEALGRTFGIPIFQEQVMQVAIIAAGFTPGQADQLRRAMAAWKRPGDLERFQQKIIDGMHERGYDGNFAQAIFRQIKGFASYGFPESHAASFALLTYVSCWLKKHEPAIFLCALLNSQPLGFYTPSQLVQDAQRKGKVEVRPADVSLSEAMSSLELRNGEIQPAVRLGLHLVSGLGTEAAERIHAARITRQFSSTQDLALRAQLDQREMQLLAAADALTSLAGHRRQQVWQASALRAMPALLHGASREEEPLELPAAAESEEVLWDYASLGLTLRSHPLKILRERLARQGLLNAAQLEDWPKGRIAKACGIVTVRQQPQTAKGTLFISLEDETGSVQVIVWPAVYAEYRSTILGSRLLAVQGVWQHGDGGVKNLLARRLHDLTPLLGRLTTESRNFR